METLLSELTIREAEPDDEAAILRAYAEAFAAAEPARPPRSSAAWRWRFLENPAGRRVMIAVAPDGRVLAQQAGLPARMRLGEQTATWTQIVDSFAVPAARRGLGHAGAFLRAAKAFTERWGGAGADQDQVLFGLPSPPAYRVGHRLLGFETVRNLNLLSAAPDAPRPAAAPAIDVEESAEFPKEVEALFPRAAAPFGAIAVRDRGFLEWRFGAPAARATGTPSRIALARRAGELVGYAVTRRGSFDGHAGLLVADWLVDPAAPEAGSALRAWLLHAASEEGAGEIVALLPEFCEECFAFQRERFRMRPTSLFQMARSWVRGRDMLWMYWNWYTTPAEIDRT